MSRSVTLMPCTHAHMFLQTHTHSRAQGDNDEENKEDLAISASGGRLFKSRKVPPPPAHI